MKTELKTVNDILFENEEYFFPSFQRGYRWGKSEVDDLLNDLYLFKNQDLKDNPDTFYCLQTLIISNDNGKNSVIDGQQRLITMYIIILYLINNNKLDANNKEKLAKFTYATQKQGNTGARDFLEEIKNGSINNQDFTRDEKHIYDAYHEVKDICENEKIKGKEDVPGIADALAELISGEKIKFLRQEYTGDKPIDVFEAINVGKIPLTDAELIRAKIILGSSSEHVKKRARKWDEIEHALQNDSMYRFLTDQENSNASRIGFLFELLVEKAMLDNEADTNRVDKDEKHWVYRYLNRKKFNSKKYNDFGMEDGDSFSDEETIDIFWDKVEDLYEAIYKWYKDIELYNYIGQITYSKSAKLLDLYTTYYDKDRNEFIWYLKMIILKSFDQSLTDDSKEAVWPKDTPYVKFLECNTISVNKGNAKKLEEMKVDNKPLKLSPKDLLKILDINDKTACIKKIKIDDGEKATLDENGNVIIKSMGDVIITPTINNIKFNLSDFLGNENSTGYKWESSDKDIATVTNGKNKTMVTAVSTGSVDITAKDTAGNTAKDTEGNPIVKRIVIENNKWTVVGYDKDVETESKQADSIRISVRIDDDVLVKMFKPLYYTGRQKDEAKLGDRARVKYFLIWSNCELLKSQMLKNREKDANRKTDSDERYRFPFDVLINEKVDIEHIDSYINQVDSENFLVKDAKQYVDIALDYLSDDKRNEVEKKDGAFEKFNAILDILLDNEFVCEDDFEHAIIDRRRIANLTLLDPGTNRGYKNNPFCIKRGSILKRSTEGQYYYPCTKMVFLKEFDPQTPDLIRWGKSDYMKYLYFLLNEFVECFYKDGTYIGLL